MLLRELLYTINKTLSENMEKEVIRVGYRDYDMIKGRQVFQAIDIERLVQEITSTKGFIYIDRAVNMTYLGIKFRLKRERSGLYNNDLTYTQINIEKEYEDKLDIDIKTIKNEYIESKKKIIEERDEKRLKNVTEFKSELAKHNINLRDFLFLEAKYKALTYAELDMLKKR